MTLSLIFVFLAGIANFAMHRALVESLDPIVQAAVLPIQRAVGRYTSYVCEFALLVIVLTVAARWPVGTIVLYGLYTMLNATVFALLTSRNP